MKEKRQSRVLVLYTGGTIGMQQTEDGYKPMTGFLQSQIKRLPMLYDEDYVELKAKQQSMDRDSDVDRDSELEELAMPVSQYGVRILYYIKEYIPIKDSSNITIEDWVGIALDIQENYDSYDGFVIIHGTDTMAYTASALSFMLENLGKSVVFTGSQVPIFEQRNDGRDNLLGSLMIAGHYEIPEVTLFFGGCVYRGCRSTKVNAGGFLAFDSPNLPPLVTMKVKIDVQWDAIFHCNTLGKFTVHTTMNPNIGLLRLFPGITAETVHAFLVPPMQGVVLQTYGVGNAPNNREDLISEFKNAMDHGVIILNCTQCIRGPVMDSYATGRTLAKIGIIPGSDMTPEAALTKLSYVLGKSDLTLKERQELLKSNLRGELTVAHTRQQFSLKDNEFIVAVASSLRTGSSKEMKYIQQALSPVLMCCAASSGDIKTLEDMLSQGADPNGTTDYDGRTPLHIACMEGNVDVVKYLLLHGASHNAKDRLGRYPLDDAVLFRHKEVVKLLHDAGAHLGKNSTEIAAELCRFAAKNRVDDLCVWQLAGANLNSFDYDKRTPLHVAVSRNNAESVKFLLESGVDPTQKDIFGHTAMDNANSYRFENIANILDEYFNGLSLKTG